MTADLWHPLSARQAGTTGLREGVQAALRQPLRTWIASQVLMNGRMAERLERRFGVAQPDDDETPRHQRLATAVKDKDLPDVVDAVLDLMPRTSDDAMGDIFLRQNHRRVTRELQEIFDDVRSVYAVRPDGYGLIHRASATARAAVGHAIKSATATTGAGSAALELKTAWESAYALHPDSEKAYRFAIKCVESAAHAVAEPANAKATLGTMKNQIRDNPSKFRLILSDGQGDVSAVVGMMAALWLGHTSRHGSKQPVRPETLEEAQAAVQLAACLVEWFTTGVVTRV